MADGAPAVRMTIYLTEDDRSGHRALWSVILDHAREEAMAGATLWRGIEGFGRSGRLRSDRFPDAAQGLPMVLEIIDSAQRIEAFVPVVTETAPEALVVLEGVDEAYRGAAGAFPLDDPVDRTVPS